MRVQVRGFDRAWLMLGLLLTVQAVGAQTEERVLVTPSSEYCRYQAINNWILVPVRLNDTLTGNMVLDTGANTYVWPQVAKQLGLKSTPLNEGGGKVRVGTLETLKVGDLKITHPDVYIDATPNFASWNTDHPEAKLIGVIGLDVVEDYAVGIDTIHRMLAFWPGGKLTPTIIRSFNSLVPTGAVTNPILTNVPPGQTLMQHDGVLSNPSLALPNPVSVAMRAHKDQHFFVPVQLNGVTLEMCVDTGSMASSLSEAVGKKLQPLGRFPGQAAGFGSSIKVTRTFLPSLAVSGITFDFPIVDIVPAHYAKDKNVDLGTVAVLGMDVFADCHLILDFPARKMYLSPAAEYNRTPLKALCHMGLYFRTNRDRVSLIFPGYPAERAGVRVGDEIVQLNDIPFADTKEADILRAFQRKTMTLTVRHSGEKETVTCVLQMDDAPVRKK